MAKLTNKTIYLDYNSTSPLANSVKRVLAEGDFPFGNPSSLHSIGRSANAKFLESKEFILDLFNVRKSHDVLFHSGATEGINTFVSGLLTNLENSIFVFSNTDHPASHRQVLDHQNYKTLKVLPNGQFDVTPAFFDEDKTYVVNWTWVNNENGAINDLKKIAEIKKVRPNVYVHVDGVQAPGKIKNWNEIPEAIDAITFSGHKFGALKGTGFSLFRHHLPFHPLVQGGGQQGGLRSGTVNVLGAYVQMLALKELVELYDHDKKLAIIDDLKQHMIDVLGDKGFLITKIDDEHLADNLLSFCIPGTHADVMLVAFDMAGLCVSAGSACSAGALLPNKNLMELGISEEDSKCYIRISIGNDELPCDLPERIENVVRRFLK